MEYGYYWVRETKQDKRFEPAEFFNYEGTDLWSLLSSLDTPRTVSTVFQVGERLHEQGSGHCETMCGDNHCDTNGCSRRLRILVEEETIIPANTIKEGDMLEIWAKRPLIDWSVPQYVRVEVVPAQETNNDEAVILIMQKALERIAASRNWPDAIHIAKETLLICK